MENLLKAVFGKTDDEYREYLEVIKTDSENYEKSYKISILSDVEKELIEFMLDTYKNSNEMPSEAYTISRFPEFKSALDKVDPTMVPKPDDVKVHVYNVLKVKVNAAISKRIMKLTSDIHSNGITDNMSKELGELKALSDATKIKEIDVNFDARQVYLDKLSKPKGMLTGINAVDEKIGGCDAGTVTTLAGFTSHFKSTFAVNIAHLNSYHRGFNIAYISLETPKDDMWWNLLSRHSYETHLNQYSYIPHDRIRKTELTQNEIDYLFGTVKKDLEDDYIDENGNKKSRGKVIFLDESDFAAFSFTEIDSVINNVDEKLDGNLDAVIVDYIQLCKFSGNGMTYDANSQINSYVTFFRRMAQNFGSGSRRKKLAVILLSQINRENWKRAKNNGGRYDITCLADANELERGSHRVLTTFTNEEMKGRNAAQVQILKNRNGATMYDPEGVYAQGDAYVFKDEVDGMSATFGGSSTMDIEAAFGDSADDLSSVLGIGL